MSAPATSSFRGAWTSTCRTCSRASVAVAARLHLPARRARCAPSSGCRPRPGHVLSAIAVVPGHRAAARPARGPSRRIDSARTMPLEVAQADGPVEETLALDTSGFGRGAGRARGGDRAGGRRGRGRADPARRAGAPAERSRGRRCGRSWPRSTCGCAAPRAGSAGSRRDSVPVVVDWSGTRRPRASGSGCSRRQGSRPRPCPTASTLVRRSGDG